MFFETFSVQKEQDALVVCIAIIYVLYAFGIILIICELGQRLTDAFAQIADEIEKFEWYLFSGEIQRILPTILIASQQPVELQCYGSIAGIRETLKQVSHTTHSPSCAENRSQLLEKCFICYQIVKSAFSYFLTIRKFL